MKSGEVTYAVRDTVIDGKEIKKGDYMGIADNGILEVDAKIDNAVMAMLKAMVDEDSALISIYAGADADRKETQKLLDKVGEEFPEIEVELQDSGQPVYYYVVSVE